MRRKGAAGRKAHALEPRPDEPRESLFYPEEEKNMRVRGRQGGGAGTQGQCAEQKLHKALAIMNAYGDENLWRELERESHKNQYDLTGILNTIRKQLRSEIGLGKDDTYYFYWLPK